MPDKLSASKNALIAGFFSCLFLFSLSTAVIAQESEPINSLPEISIDQDAFNSQSIEAGNPVEIKGVFLNNYPFPLTDVQIGLTLGRIGDDGQLSFVQKSIIADSLNVAPEEGVEFTQGVQLPKDLSPGNYRFNVFALSARRFPLTGNYFLLGKKPSNENRFAQANFTLEGEAKKGIYINPASVRIKSSVQIEGNETDGFLSASLADRPYLIAYTPQVEVAFDVTNNSSEEIPLNVQIAALRLKAGRNYGGGLLGNSAVFQDNPNVSQQEIVLGPGETKNIIQAINLHNFPNFDQLVLGRLYELDLQALPLAKTDVPSLYQSPVLLLEDEVGGVFTKVGLADLPAEKDQSFMFYAEVANLENELAKQFKDAKEETLQAPTGEQKVGLEVTFLNRNGDIVGQITKDDLDLKEIASFKQAVVAPENLDYLLAEGQIYNSQGVTVDSFNLEYDCEANPSACFKDKTPASVSSSQKVLRSLTFAAIVLAVVLVVIFILVRILKSISKKK